MTNKYYPEVCHFVPDQTARILVGTKLDLRDQSEEVLKSMHISTRLVTTEEV